MQIREIVAGHYAIPLPVALSDSTHGTIKSFELCTARVRDSEGAEGTGYTYTVGAGGAAVHALIARDLAPLLVGRDADLIESHWQTMWWGLHYGGRGGAQALAMSAVDIALWDLRARRQGAPLWRVLGGFDPRVPCYAGGIDLDFPLDALLRQTDENLARGFRAIKMKVGRPSLRDDVERVRAMRRHLGPDFPLMVDANMRWSVDEAIRAARAHGSACPQRVERFPVEFDAVTRAVGRDGEALDHPQRLGDEAVQTEAVSLQVRAVRRGREQVDREVVRAVRGHRQVEGLREVADLHERGDPAAVGDVGLRERDPAS